MKQIIILLLIISNYYSYSQSTLKFIPEKPEAGNIINIEYSASKRFINYNSVDLLIYAYDSVSIHPTGYEARLTKNNNIFSGKFEIPSNAVYLLFKIFAASKEYDIIDNNNGLLWEILVYKNNVTVKNANLNAALARLGSTPSNINRLPDYYSALDFLKTETELYPQNYAAELGLLTTMYDLKKINKETFTVKINELSNRKVDLNNEADVRTKVRALYANNEEPLASKIEKEFVKKYNNSDFAEEYAIAEISKAESFNDFVKQADIYFEKFPNSMNKDRIYIAYVTAFLQNNKITELVNRLDSMKFSGYLYARIAKSLFEYYKSKNLINNKNNQEILITLLAKADSIHENDVKNQQNPKPKIYTIGEWNDILDVQSGTIAEIKAEVFQEINKDMAGYFYERAISQLRENANDKLYENYIKLLISNNDTLKALNMAESAIIKGKVNEKIFSYHQELYNNLKNVNDSIYNSVLDSLFSLSQQFKKEIYLNELLNQPEYQYSLQTIDETFIDFRDLKGKIIAMNFFASWCEPCEAMYPAFMELFELYSQNKDVEIVAVNSFEEEKFKSSDLKNYIERKGIFFPVVKDVLDIIPRQIGINGIPAIAILDKKSRVRFILKGYSNKEKLLDDAAGRIEFLLQNEYLNE